MLTTDIIWSGLLAPGRKPWLYLAFMRPAASEGGQHAPVDIDHLTVDEIGRARGEEQRGAHQLLRLAPAARRRPRPHPLVEGGVRQERDIQIGLEVARPDRVHLDVVG